MGGSAEVKRTKFDEDRNDTALLRDVFDDEWAFPEFYRRHFFDLAGWLYSRTGDAEAAHGIANEAMAKAFSWAIKPGRDDIEYPRAWIFTIARHELGRWRRVGEVETPVADGFGFPEAVEDARLVAIVDHSDLYEALDELSDDEALALVMAYGEGHTVADVADAIGRSREATKKVLQRAAKRVRERLRT